MIISLSTIRGSLTLIICLMASVFLFCPMKSVWEIGNMALQMVETFMFMEMIRLHKLTLIIRMDFYMESQLSNKKMAKKDGFFTIKDAKPSIRVVLFTQKHEVSPLI